MLNPHKISPFTLLAAVAFLALGELLAGTRLSFVAMMSTAMICIGITYNILGGIGTMGGMFFSAFALGTLVISQFAKVFFFEAADRNLEAPQLTIEIYMIFYLCVMIGTFLFVRIRLNLPKALEPATGKQSELMYTISVSLGLIAASGILKGSEIQHTPARDLALVFSNLLLFSIVLAIETRISDTDGLHSFGIKVFIPAAAFMIIGFLGTSRGGIVVPILVYALTCYVKGFQFRRKHYITAALGIVAFVTVISPIEIYLRQFREPEKPFWERNYTILYHFATIPDWPTVAAASEEANQESAGRIIYYQRSGTFVLGRFSMIRPDSNLINACSGGYHYGFTALKTDLLVLIPYFLYKNKPVNNSSEILGRVSGVITDEMENTYPSFSAISDSYGAFEWWGVILVAMFLFPAVIIIYESIFDIRRPWGIVALGVLFTSGRETGIGGLLGVAIRAPIQLLLLSYLIGGIVRMIPMRGDR
jgi:hypothetical protein